MDELDEDWTLVDDEEGDLDASHGEPSAEHQAIAGMRHQGEDASQTGSGMLALGGIVLGNQRKP